MKKLLFITVVLSGFIYMYCSTVNSTRSSLLTLANLEALAGLTPGEENPPEKGIWQSADPTEPPVYLQTINLYGHCFNEYSYKAVFVCTSSGTEYGVCGTNSTGKLQVPCTCP